MWVQSIELEHWRVFDQRRIRIADLSPGINILFGPNEAGKSTVVDAMARLLFDRPKTTSSNLLRPWGSEATPEGALVLETGGQRYRIEKRFHPTTGNAVLRIGHGLGFRDYLQDDGVQEFVHAVVGGQKAGRGLSKYENWGLLRLLWALQDENVVPAEPSPEVQERLGPLLGRDPLADPGQVQPLLHEVERRFGLWFTPTGRPSKGSPIAEREEESARLEAEQTRLEQALARTRDLGRHLREELEEEKEQSSGTQAEEQRREELVAAGRRFEELQLLHAQAERRHEAALTHQRQFEQVQAQLRDGTLQFRLLQQQIQQGDQHLRELRTLEDLARAERHEADLKAQSAQDAYSQTQSGAQRAGTRRDALHRLLGRHEEMQRSRAQQQQIDLALQEADLTEHQLQEREAAAGLTRQTAQQREQAAQTTLETASVDLEQARLLQERRDLEAELERVGELETQVARLDAGRKALHPASAEDLRALEVLETDEIRARAVMQSERVVVDLRADKEMKAVVRVDGRLEEEPLAAKASVRYEGVQLRLVLPGATLAIGRPGLGEQAAKKLTEIETRKAELLSRYGVQDLESLRTQGQQAQQIEREAELRREELKGRKPRVRIEARLAQLPTEAPSLEAANERLAAAQAEHKQLQSDFRNADRDLEAARQALVEARQQTQRQREERRGHAGRTAALAEQIAAEAASLGLSSTERDALEHAATLSAHAAAEAERAAQEAQARLEPLRAALAASRDKLGALEKQSAATEAELRNHRISQTEVQTRQLRLLDGRTEEGLQEQVAAAATAVDQALRHKARLEDLPTLDPRLELEAVENALKQLRRDREERQLRQVRLEQELEQLGSQGLYEKLAQVKERLAVCRRELEAERLKASATRHLKDLLEQAQEEARRKLGGPIREWVALRTREVLGDQYSGVQFSSGMTLDQVVRRGEGSPAAVTDLSRGTRDLLGLLVRLAIAELVSKQERQLVVLDDVLVHADAGRRRRLLKILQEASAHVQVLICTCHVDQYAPLGDEAKRFDLEQLKSAPAVT